MNRIRRRRGGIEVKIPYLKRPVCDKTGNTDKVSFIIYDTVGR